LPVIRPLTTQAQGRLYVFIFAEDIAAREVVHRRLKGAQKQLKSKKELDSLVA
jgi:hypothetical protein